MNSKHRFRLAALIFATACVAIAPSAAAQEQPDPSQLSLTYNEEVVRKLLEETDPDVAFFARLRMMRGHLNAAILTADLGDTAEAHEHVKHPSSEILPEIDEALKTHGLTELPARLQAVVDNLNSKDTKATQQAIETVLAELTKGEATIDLAKMSAGGILPDTIVVLLRTAVAEYGEAFEYGKIVNLVEYHDGAAFVAEARKLLKLIEPGLTGRDAKAMEKILQSWGQLETAWPGARSPESAVLPIGKMLALVTIIELQLNKLRGGA